MEPGLPRGQLQSLQTRVSRWRATQPRGWVDSRDPGCPVLPLQTRVTPTWRGDYREGLGAIVTRSPGYTCGNSCGLGVSGSPFLSGGIILLSLFKMFEEQDLKSTTLSPQSSSS